MSDLHNTNRDVGYRLKLLDSQTWFGSHRSQIGIYGVAPSVYTARKSARANGIKKGTYEIWKIHIGDINSKTPYFPPEKVV